jgi:hypothetical protein
MVTQFGMSEKIGAMAVGDKEQEIFLGRELGQRRTDERRKIENHDTLPRPEHRTGDAAPRLEAVYG